MFTATLAEQVACVRREIALRERVYPNWVAAGRMKQTEATCQLETMRAVLETVIKVERFAGRLGQHQ
jgi:hypothetical protein